MTCFCNPIHAVGDRSGRAYHAEECVEEQLAALKADHRETLKIAMDSLMLASYKLGMVAGQYGIPLEDAMPPLYGDVRIGDLTERNDRLEAEVSQMREVLEELRSGAARSETGAVFSAWVAATAEAGLRTRRKRRIDGDGTEPDTVAERMLSQCPTATVHHAHAWSNLGNIPCWCEGVRDGDG